MAAQRKTFPRLFLARAEPFRLIGDGVFVRPPDRGTGVADLLIDACVQECRRHGAAKLGWQTARDNARAQAVYRRVGATRDEWVDYWLAVSPASS